MPPHVRETVTKIAVASLIVGLFLSFFDIDPRALLADFGETVQQIFSVVASIVEWMVKYLLLGAIVVVPVWLIFFVIGQVKNRNQQK